MQKQEYDKMDRLENEMWWYTGLHSHLLFFLRHALAGRKDALVLDAGCGTGGFLEMAAKDLPGSWVVGLDAVERACLSARVKSGCPVCVGSVNAVPFAKNAFTAIVSADVLCHRSVDEAQALLSFNRCLVTGGTLVLNVPAYQWLYSAHDRAVYTVRRYTTTRLRQLLREAGFARVTITYWNTFLFPLMVLRRILTRRHHGSDVMKYPVPVNFVFRILLSLESLLLRRGVTLPFGGSVLAVAVK